MDEEETDNAKLIIAIRKRNQLVKKSADYLGVKEGEFSDKIIPVEPTTIDSRKKSFANRLYRQEGVLTETKPIEVVSLFGLEEAIAAINHTQKQFEKYLKYREGGVYKFSVDASYFLLSVIGKDKVKPTIENFYEIQHSNVARVNEITGQLIKQSAPIVNQLRQSIKDSVRQLGEGKEEERELEDMLPKLLDEYEGIEEEIKNLSQDDENYYGKLSKLLDLRWETSAMGFGYIEGKKRQVFSKEEVKHLMVLDELLTTFFYNVESQRITSKDFQETLAKYRVIYPTVESLARGSKVNESGIHILGDYEKRLSERFRKSLKQVTSRGGDNPYFRNLTPETLKLKQLFSEAQEISRRKTLQYENMASNAKLLDGK